MMLQLFGELQTHSLKQLQILNFHLISLRHGLGEAWLHVVDQEHHSVSRAQHPTAFCFGALAVGELLECAGAATATYAMQELNRNLKRPIPFLTLAV